MAVPFGRTLFAAFALLVLSSATAAAQNDSVDTADTLEQCPPSGLSVIIASDQNEISAFQRTVVERVENALARAGHAVSRIDVAALETAKPSPGNAIIVLNAVDTDELRGPVRDIVRRAASAEMRERVLISTVTGGDWTGKHTQVHAVTGASRDYSIDSVVRTIVKRVTTVLECDTTVVPADSGAVDMP
ncbi:MAG: hypothetical protein GF331_05120 [Chitinivibrionales bacterium]|nr:hypothetical protein [Chitinivibrionales bacterium]